MPRNPAEIASLEDAAPSFPSDARLPGVSRPASPQRSRAQLDTESAAPLLGAGDDDNDSSGSSDSVPLRSGWEDEAKSNGTWNKKAVSTRMLALGACALAALVAVGALMVSDNSAASPVPPAHHSPNSASGDGGGAGHGGGVANGGSAVDAACLPIDGCGGKTICYPATGEKTCATCAHGFYRFSEEGKQAPRCLHNTVTLAQAGFPESAAGTYTLHLAADAVPLDLSVGASVSIPTAVVLTISREPTRPQPVLDVRFQVLGSLHVVGAAGIVHEVDSAGFFTAENTAAETPLFITRVSTTVASGEIDSGGLITPVVSGRSTGATFSFTRVAMPVNVTGDGKSVCSLLADVKPAHLQGNQFSFSGVSLTNITDGIRKNKMVLDGDPAHELTLVLPAGRFADLRTFIIPADKTLTVRGVDTLAVPAAGVPVRPKIEMTVTVSAGGVLRLEHLAAADAMTPQVASGGELQMDHVTANYTLLQTIFSPSGSGTYSFVETVVYERGEHVGTVGGGPIEFSLRLEPSVMLDMASLEVGSARSLAISGAKTGAQPRAMLSISTAQSIKVDVGSTLTLTDMEMPMCGFSVSDHQLGTVVFDSIKLRDTMADYTYRDTTRRSSRPSHTVHERYMKCMHVDDWDACHSWCNARDDDNDNNQLKPPSDTWWTSTSSYNKAPYNSHQQFDDCREGSRCNGCLCNDLAENQCWITNCANSDVAGDWLPQADCGASTNHHPVMCSDGTTPCTARLTTGSNLYSQNHILRKDKCEQQKDNQNPNAGPGPGGKPGKFIQACGSTNRTGKFPYCTQAWLASLTNKTEKAEKMKAANFKGDPDSITVNPTCPWTGDNAHLCTDRCLDYQWVDDTDIATSIEPMCKNDPFAFAFWNMTKGQSNTLDPFVSDAEYGTISGNIEAGYSVDFVYEDWTFPVMDLTVRPSSKTSIAGLDYTKTQLSISNELTVPRTATLTLKKLALVFPRLAPSFDNHSVTFLRVDGVLTLDAVAVPSSVFTTSVSTIFQDWDSGKIVFNGARLYRETDFAIPPTCGVQQFPDHWMSVLPSDSSRQFVNASCTQLDYYSHAVHDPTTCHCAPQVTVQITLATLSGDALSDAGLTFTLVEAPGAYKSGVYNLHSDGRLAADPPSFVPTGFGFFAPVHSETNYVSSLPRGLHPLQEGYGGCNITDRGRCVSQHYGFVRDDNHCSGDACSLNTADRWDLIQKTHPGRGHWNSTKKSRSEWGDEIQCRYADTSHHTGCPTGCDDNPAAGSGGCTGSATQLLDRWIPDLDPDGNFSYRKQWSCNISSSRQCTMPADQLKCADWECDATKFGAAQCALARSTCDEQALSPWSDCSRPRNQTGDGRQLNCTAASCSCAGCDDQYKPLHCMPHDPSCQHIGVAESTSCAKTAVEWEVTCSAMSPTGGAVMEVQDSGQLVNKSTEEYTVHGIEATGGPWARNTTHCHPNGEVLSMFEGGTCHEQCNPGAYVLTCNATGPAVCEIKPGTSTSYEPTCTAAADKAACDKLSQTCLWGEFQPSDVQYYDTNQKRMMSHHCAALGDRFCSEETSKPPGTDAHYSDNTVAHLCTESKDVLYADSNIPGSCQQSPSKDSFDDSSSPLMEDRLGDPCLYQYGENQPAYSAQKGSNWSMWNETLLANSIAISSSGAWDGEPQRFGPSLPGSPVGERLLPGDTKVQWDDRFGYNDGKVFRETPWKVCF